MRKEIESLLNGCHSMKLAEIRDVLSGIGPPYPRRLFNALSKDRRNGVQKLLKDLKAKQQAEARKKRRLRQLLRYERQAETDGFKIVAGVDEVGRGPLAGPVVAAAAVLPPGMLPVEINDSKLLNDTQRREALSAIVAVADVGIGVVSAEEIDRINIHRASLLAMKFAIEDLNREPDLVLVDGQHPVRLPIPERVIVKGDRLCMSIAAASIVAKVTRDQIMLEFDKRYPQYKFARHKGYATSEHLALIREFGVSPIHRRSFAPVRECFQYQLL